MPFLNEPPHLLLKQGKLLVCEPVFTAREIEQDLLQEEGVRIHLKVPNRFYFDKRYSEHHRHPLAPSQTELRYLIWRIEEFLKSSSIKREAAIQIEIIDPGRFTNPIRSEG